MIENNLVWIPFILLSYFLLGFLLKFADASFDDKLFSKKKSFFIMLIVAVFSAILMYLSDETKIIFIAFIIGLVLAKKIDNYAFITAAFICFTIFFIVGGTIDIIYFNIEIFTILFVAILLEEKINYKKDKWFKTKKGKLFSFIFEYGVMVKLSGFVAFVILSYNPLYFFAIILFDLGYDLMILITHKKLGKKILWNS
ncbi:MAG: hypothetical protein PHP82_00225 [Candidatus ainarchaeum sp.]|nr:hypothetical protein [Candidatus ainarchaeum sp.]